jgi:glycosyltransferase involved in cell wall biosynthesis
MNPALCIVVPVLDEAPTLAPCLGALQPLRERGARVVVVDGGSSDHSLAIARRHRFFRALMQATGVDLLVQSGGDLGTRMHSAFRLHCVRGPLRVVGTDCPALLAAP